MTNIPQKVRCVNTKTGQVKYISESITEKPFFKQQNWMTQELEEGEVEEELSSKKAPKIDGPLLNIDSNREAKEKAAKKRLEEQKETKRLEEEAAAKEEDEGEEEQERSDEIEAKFKADLISVKGIGEKSADDIIEVYEVEENLVEAISGEGELPFTADICKALKEGYNN